MQLEIIIKGREGRFNVPFFTLSDNESLHIKIGAPVQNIGSYYFLIQHGKAVKREILNSPMTVELTAEWLKKGGTEPIVCELELRDRSGVVVYKKYNIEALEIKESKVGTEYFAGIQKLEKENVDLRKELGEVKTELAELKKMVTCIPTAIEKAKKEAVIEAAGGDPMGA